MIRAFKIALLAFLPVLVLAWFYIDRVQFVALLSAYGLLSVGRILFQIGSAVKVGQRKTRRYKLPPATMLVTVYEEEAQLFEQALRSLVAQDYPDLHIVVIDDGSTNNSEIEAICQKYSVEYMRQHNQGKRMAIYSGFSRVKPQSKVILTADSDTVWNKDAAAELVRSIIGTKNAGAATGYVGVLNANDSLLTRLVSQRYWIAFKQERAAQSLFGVVTCISGPLGAYRRDVFERIKDDFINQRFLGRACTFGDDRHLTNLVLGLGYKVVYAPKAECYTYAPTDVKTYITQQNRWGKSHWREMIWQFKALRHQHLYLSYDWILTLILPFLLTASVINYTWLAATGQPHYLIILCSIMIGMGLIRALHPLIATRDIRFVWFIAYSFFHIVFLLPLKFYSLATVAKTGWGTRGMEPETNATNIGGVKDVKVFSGCQKDA